MFEAYTAVYALRRQVKLFAEGRPFVPRVYLVVDKRVYIYVYIYKYKLLVGLKIRKN